MNRPDIFCGRAFSAPRQISQQTLLGESRVSRGGDGLVELAENQPAMATDAAQFLASEIGPRYRQRVQPFQAPTLLGCSPSA